MSHSRTLLRKMKTAKKGRHHRTILAKGERNARMLNVSHYAAGGFIPGIPANKDHWPFEALGLDANYHVTKGLRINREGAQ